MASTICLTRARLGFAVWNQKTDWPGARACSVEPKNNKTGTGQGQATGGMRFFFIQDLLFFYSCTAGRLNDGFDNFYDGFDILNDGLDIC